mmetsp:Transcript_47087/g.100115  ORF Transcript_47087/g.100115 Transcript_47087/m.100115 type:complete len:411 (-) Transcript_47087:139-1371(-)
MVRLVELVGGVNLRVHGVELLVLLRHLLQNALHLPHEGSVLLVGEEVGDGIAEGEVVHAVGEVGHGRVEVVVHALGLDVEVPGDAVHHEVAGHLASGVVGTGRAGAGDGSRLVLVLVRRVLRLPVLVLLLHLELSLGVARQRGHRPVHFVVGEDGLALLVPAQGGEGHDPLVLAELGVDDAVDLADSDGHAHFVHLLGELFPRGVQTLTPDAPWSIHVDERHLVVVQEALKIVRSELDGLLPVLVQLLQRLLVLLVLHLPLLPIPPREDAPLPVLVELPLLDVLRHVLTVGPQGVPHVHGDVVAVQVHEGHVEVESDLGLVVLVEGDGGAHVGPGEGQGLGEEEDAHDAHGAEGHEGSEGRRLGQILRHAPVEVHRRHGGSPAAAAVNVVRRAHSCSLSNTKRRGIGTRW